ncbi:MAG: hypothetical protein VX535_10760 [Pseudomonadota bacterium]|nr:hypothetical protein [Pseudomonadota bacterium]
MKVPSFLSPFVDGDSPKRLFQGLAAGVIGTMVIGFGWGGWNVGSTVEQKVEAAGVSAMVAALAPICADKFERAAKADNDLIVKINAVDSWQRDAYLKQAGWTTFPGGAEPDNDVAEACATLLNTSLKLK